jgi:Rieske 2Fe-2S family protein
MNAPQHPASPLLDHCPETLPAAAYRDPAWFAHEMRTIWAREWVAVGRLSDLPPGTLRRATVAGQSVLLARDAAGALSAFHNVCRHRGAELCAEAERPLGRLITCPYHTWAYGTDGRLVSTAFATPTADFRREDHGLLPVALRVWAGTIFLCLAADPPDLTPDLGLDALDAWPMDALVTGHREVRGIACNWKVFWENYNECLHCPGVHPALSERVPVYAKGVMSAAETDDPPPGPVLGGAQSWTVSGRACGPGFPGLSAEQRAAGHTFVTTYPSTFMVGHVDYIRSVRLEPTGPETTRLTAEWLFLPETLALPGFDLRDVVDFAGTVLAEDAAACEMNQRGLASSAYRRGRLMPQEFDIARFHEWVTERTGPIPEPDAAA